jgi:hypothetical protein
MNGRLAKDLIFWAIFTLSAVLGLIVVVQIDRHLHHGYSDGTTCSLMVAASGLLLIVLCTLRFRAGQPLPYMTALATGFAPSVLLTACMVLSRL